MPLHRLEHVLVLTDDLEATKAFYCDVLGFEAGERPQVPFPGYWLYLDGVPCLHIADRAAYVVHAEELGLGRVEGPIDHLAFVAGSREALLARLEAAGVRAVPNDAPVAGVGVRQLFLEDPNGVRIELSVR
jgi:catechol 2,3-dioxygenase-like lactoylglutathione lyase family enzyme